MTHLDLFSGIGGFSLAAQWVWGNDHHIHSFVEIDPFCQKVLAKNFPGVPIHGDIKTFTYPNRNGLQEPGAEQQTDRDRQFFKDNPVDLITGGFPCQSFSHAGKRKGRGDDRYLWPEMFRVIRMVHPRWIIAENVPGLISIENGLVFEQVHLDLESEGYQVQAFIIPACAVNATHRRDRVWIVANSRCWKQGQCGKFNKVSFEWNGQKRSTGQIGRSDCHAPNSCGQGLQVMPCGQLGSLSEKDRRTEGSQFSRNISKGKQWEESWLEVATRLCRVDARVSNRVDRLKSLGNAIVPQVIYPIMVAIKNIEKEEV